MADPQTTRFASEVLASSPESAQVTRQGLQVGVNKPGANAAATADVTRFASEVLAEFPDRASVTRQGLQVGISQPGANAAATADVARFSQEILAEVPPKAGVTRQGLQVGINKPGFNAAASVEVTRSSFEVLARSFIPMTSFSIPAEFELFLHNWATAARMESLYSTDITASAEQLAEQRTALLQKPYRNLSVRWAVKGNSESREMLTEMRRLVDATSVVPIYMDVVELSQDASTSDTTIYGDFSRGRFFRNGPVVIVRLEPAIQGGATRVVGWESAVIDTPFNNRLRLSSGISNDLVAGRCVILPVMKTHPQTTLEFTFLTNNLIELNADFDEVYGPTALPPTASDLPDNFDSYAGHPILSTVPQWDRGYEMSFVRAGEQAPLGRGRVVYQRGDRHRVIHGLRFQEARAKAWDLIRLFDTRRGRLLPFWMIDPENVHSVSLISPTFVSVTPAGTLSDFQAETDYVGFVFSDGTAAVRQATTIQLVGGSWRVTLDTSLPAGYVASDIELFGRARLCRNDSDSLIEEWQTTNLCSLNIAALELLAEQEVTL